MSEACDKMLSEAGRNSHGSGRRGVPVVEKTGGALRAVNAVIDKDFATSLLGIETGFKPVINLTQIDMAYLRFQQATGKRH